MDEQVKTTDPQLATLPVAEPIQGQQDPTVKELVDGLVQKVKGIEAKHNDGRPNQRVRERAVAMLGNALELDHQNWYTAKLLAHQPATMPVDESIKAEFGE